MSTRLVTLATFSSPAEAAVARNVLLDAGIAAEISGGTTNSFWGGMFGDVGLLVHETDVVRADQLLEEALGEPLEAEDKPIESADDVASPSEFAPNTFDRSPALEKLARKCDKCGARVHAGEVRCWSCGASQSGDAKPYYVPGASALCRSPIATKPSALPAPEHVRDLLDRAWRAAWLSPMLLPPLPNFYSAWLLLLAAREADQLPPPYQRKFVGTLVINLIVVLAMAMIIWTVFSRV